MQVYVILRVGLILISKWTPFFFGQSRKLSQGLKVDNILSEPICNII